MQTPWSLHLLSEILSSFSTEDPDNLRNVINRVAESVDAEVAAIITDFEINCCIGLSSSDRDLLLRMAEQQPSMIDLRSGSLQACWAPLGGKDLLFVGRLGEPFDLEERSLIRAMGRSIELSISMLRAISAERQAKDDAHRQATHDALTGLPNRRLVLQSLEAAIAGLRDDGGLLRPTLLFIDVDRFKLINDVHGHGAGDQLLVVISQILRQAVRGSDLVGRLSGDEFILMTNTSSSQAAEDLAQRIIDAIGQPIHISGSELIPTASIGIAFARPGDVASVLLENADMAMYQAKALGRGRFALFEESMRTSAQRRLLMEEELRYALKNRRIECFFQPIYRLATDTIAGFEALARWHHPTRGLIYPEDFIDLAEDSEVIIDVDMEIFAQACAAIARWQKLDGVGPLRLSSNLSARSLMDPQLQDRIQVILDSHEILPRDVYLEITETVLVDDIQSTVSTINALQRMGLQLAIDDFGTGYSSLLYLKRFPVGVLKIDRSFVDGLGLNGEDETIAKTILSLAMSLGVQVVAEGVETEAQCQILKDLGCDFGQGFYFGRPENLLDTEIGLLALPCQDPTPAVAAETVNAPAAEEMRSLEGIPSRPLSRQG